MSKVLKKDEIVRIADPVRLYTRCSNVYTNARLFGYKGNEVLVLTDCFNVLELSHHEVEERYSYEIKDDCNPPMTVVEFIQQIEENIENFKVNYLGKKPNQPEPEGE